MTKSVRICCQLTLVGDLHNFAIDYLFFFRIAKIISAKKIQWECNKAIKQNLVIKRFVNKI